MQQPLFKTASGPVTASSGTPGLSPTSSGSSFTRWVRKKPASASRSMSTSIAGVAVGALP